MLTILAIAIVAISLLFLLALILPKQGAIASNRPVNSSNQLPNPTTDLRTESYPSKAGGSSEQTSPTLGDETLVSTENDVALISVDIQVRNLLQSGKKIPAIKIVREFTGWSLKRAKAYVDAYPNIGSLISPDHSDVCPTPNEVSDDPNEQLCCLMDSGKTIIAIKHVRFVTGWSLRQATEYVDDYPNVPPL